MRRRTSLLLVVLAVLATAVTVAAAPAPFTPKSIGGTWKGNWTNTTFGSTGPASFVATATKTTLAFKADLGGNVFGCPDPPPDVTRPMKKGSGAMRWNDAGFRIAGGSKGLGQVTFTYKHPTRTLIGSGVSPGCSPGLSWKLSGRFAGTQFTGTVQITLATGRKATSKLALRRS